MGEECFCTLIVSIAQNQVRIIGSQKKLKFSFQLSLEVDMKLFDHLKHKNNRSINIAFI